MLTKLQLELSYEGKEKLSYQISSLMQGVIMDYVDMDYGEILHRQGVKPYSQYVEKITDDTLIWNICTLNEQAKSQIIDRICQSSQFHLNHKNMDIKIQKSVLTEKTYEELIEQYYFNDQKRLLMLRFLSPVSFKSQKRYMIFPEVRHIFQSLMNKYDFYSSQTKVGEDDTLKYFEEYSYIRSYHLRSTSFAIEGNYIPSFIGKIGIQLNGPQPFVNLAHMLAAFGEYSGLGIKAASGMGAIKKED